MDTVASRLQDAQKAATRLDHTAAEAAATDTIAAFEQLTPADRDAAVGLAQDAWCLRSEARRALGDHHGAFLDAAGVCRRWPELPRGYAAVSDVLHKVQRFEEALDYLHTAAQLTPGSAVQLKMAITKLQSDMRIAKVRDPDGAGSKLGLELDVRPAAFYRDKAAAAVQGPPEQKQEAPEAPEAEAAPAVTAPPPPMGDRAALTLPGRLVPFAPLVAFAAAVATDHVAGSQLVVAAAAAVLVAHWLEQRAVPDGSLRLLGVPFAVYVAAALVYGSRRT